MSQGLVPRLVTGVTLANLERLHAGLDDRSKDRFALVGVCKHFRDLVQEAGHMRGTQKPKMKPWPRHVLMSASGCVLLGDDGLGLLVADEEAVEQRHKHLGRVGDHHHLRLGQSALHVVEVEDLVVGDKADLNGRALGTVLSGEGGTCQFQGFILLDRLNILQLPVFKPCLNISHTNC